jgi:putative transposase
MRNVLAHAGRQGRRVVSAFIGTTFVQDDAAAASVQWRQVADQLRSKVPKLAALMDEGRSPLRRVKAVVRRPVRGPILT